MKFSTKTRYGIRAMLEIAKDESQSGVFQKDIAANQDISVKYLDQIIHALKVAGLIINLKGRKSGYILTRNASEITMLDIHNAFEPGICVIDCLAKSFDCERKSFCEVIGFWEKLNHMVVDYFEQVTLEDIRSGKVKLDQ
ncbi:RrF2 family transcriptional regulator [Sunxiuqinia elliptica]|uniref:BadM/Rrf2 family transcriptional regulator n=1 Tax=Sunxiuqinia elliptica TaxID=655355 RepID=A0A4R6GRN3_9BACT|nr:Rrf2 family transcriptional regulator [Sunxiuqinia elliptica]TDN97244.1 BadM/Rrf2 family transcriptional regulator [Sunxiuqinia elliptica]TDO60572.1 BadM/Rrf2 family transcriptional regulator [Sunxiuqinia elliptica]